MLYLLQKGPFKVLTSLIFQIQHSRQLLILELPSLLRSCFFWRSHTYQHCVFLFGLLQIVYLHFATWPIWPSANAAPLPYPRRQASYPLPPTLYLLPLYPHHHCFMFLADFLYLLLFFSPMTSSEFFNEMLGVSEPAALQARASSTENGPNAKNGWKTLNYIKRVVIEQNTSERKTKGPVIWKPTLSANFMVSNVGLVYTLTK